MRCQTCSCGDPRTRTCFWSAPSRFRWVPQAFLQTHVLAYQRTGCCQMGLARGFLLQISLCLMFNHHTDTNVAYAFVHSHSARHI